ncbi:MAG: hypothetical protein P8O75_03340 [Gammaproteobacteria bacterium]|jgi:hypothetical protein|nr:hypothetical protein [Gammaproteobacteria bacterium]
MFDFIIELSALPVYSYGLVLFSLIAIVPAIVSGNMAQHLASQLIKGNANIQLVKHLAFNLTIFIACVGWILFTLITYLR